MVKLRSKVENFRFPLNPVECMYPSSGEHSVACAVA